MTKEVSLSHSERLELSKILNVAKFKTLADMGFAMEDAKAVAHSPEEVKEIDLKLTDDHKNVVWNEDGKEKAISLSDTTVTAFNEAISARETAGDITIGDKNLITLAAKLK